MNILQVSHSFYPCYQAGGVVKVAYDISQALVKKGHKVTVVTTDGCSRRLTVKTNTEMDVEGIRVWYFRNISNYLRIKFKFATPYLLPLYLRKQIKNFDIIHIHEHRTILAAITHYYAMKYHVPYIVQTHGDLTHTRTKQMIKHFFDQLWGKTILNDASKVLVLNDDEFTQCKKFGVNIKNISILNNFLDLNLYNKLPDKMKYRNKLSLKNTDKIILYLGRIEQSKGIDLLLDAFVELSKEIDDLYLIVIGPDEGYKNKLINRINSLNVQEKVKLMGYINERGKIEAFVAADIHVSPRLWEPFGITLLESCACGTPVICSEGCGIAHHINEQVGLVFSNNAESLKKSMFKILTDESLKKRFSGNGRNLIEQKFNVEKIIEIIEKEYFDILNG